MPSRPLFPQGADLFWRHRKIFSKSGKKYD
ncbi:hypothetical protein N872_05115 [Neisseria meningitidis LNP27256]|nr:hypothetical protein N872_05115 [Neisseria meningitidis LNP27256]